MSAHLDCIPCLCRETLAAVRRATDDPAVQQAVVGEALFHLAMRDPAAPSPALARDLHDLILQRTGRDVSLMTPADLPCPLAEPPAPTTHSP
jgi:hypothetical protein